MLDEFQNKSYYEMLGVSFDATRDEIGRVYRDLCRVYHPDSNFYADIIDDPPRKEHQGIFKAITCAYNTLVDDQARARYDESILGAKTTRLTTRVHETNFSGMHTGVAGIHSPQSCATETGQILTVQLMRGSTPPTNSPEPRQRNRPALPRPLSRNRSRTYEWAESLPSISQIIRHEQPSRFRSVVVILVGAVFGGILGTVLINFLK